MSVDVGIKLSGLSPDFFKKLAKTAVDEYGKITQASIESDAKIITSAKSRAKTEDELLKKQADQKQALLDKQWEAEKQLGANVGALKTKFLKDNKDLEEKQAKELSAFRLAQDKKEKDALATSFNKFYSEGTALAQKHEKQLANWKEQFAKEQGARIFAQEKSDEQRRQTQLANLRKDIIARSEGNAGGGPSLDSVREKRIQQEIAAHKMGFRQLEHEYESHSKKVVDLKTQLSQTSNKLKREEIQKDIAEEQRATAILRKEYQSRDEVIRFGAGAKNNIFGLGRNLASSTAVSNALAITGGSIGFAEMVKMGEESVRLEAQLRGAFKGAGASAQEASIYIRQAALDYENYGKALGITEDHYKELSRIAAFTGHFLGEQNRQLVIAAAAIEKQTAGSEGEITADRFIRGISQGMFSDEGKETFGRLRMSMPAFVKDLEQATDKEDLFKRAIAGTNEQVKAQKEFIESAEGTLERETVRRENQVKRLGTFIVGWIGSIGQWAENADIRLDRFFGTVQNSQHGDVIRQLNEEIADLEKVKKTFDPHMESELIKDIDRSIAKKKEQIAGYQKETEAAKGAAAGIGEHKDALDKDTISAQKAKAANDDFKASIDKQRTTVTDLEDEATRLAITLKDPVRKGWAVAFDPTIEPRLKALPGLIRDASKSVKEYNDTHRGFEQYDASVESGGKTTGGGSRLKKEFELRKKTIEAGLKDEERDAMTARSFSIISEDEANRRILLARVKAYRDMAALAHENKYAGLISPEEEADANLASAQALDEYTKHRAEIKKKSADAEKELIKKSYEEDASEQKLFYEKKLLAIEDLESRLFVSKEQADIQRAKEEEQYWEQVLLIAESYGVPLVEILTKIEEAKTHVLQAQKALRDKQEKDDTAKQKELIKTHKEQFGDYESLTRIQFSQMFMAYEDQWDKPFRDSLTKQAGLFGSFLANFSHGLAGILAGKAAKGIANIFFPEEKEKTKGLTAGNAGNFLQSLRLFGGGGYTGDGSPDEIAGLVHKGEFVLTPEITAQLMKGGSVRDPNYFGGAVERFPMTETPLKPVTEETKKFTKQLEEARKEEAARRKEEREHDTNLQLATAKYGVAGVRMGQQALGTLSETAEHGANLGATLMGQNTSLNPFHGPFDEAIQKNLAAKVSTLDTSLDRAADVVGTITGEGAEMMLTGGAAHHMFGSGAHALHGAKVGFGTLAAAGMMGGAEAEAGGAPGFTDADISKTQQNAIKTIGIASDMASKIKAGKPEQAVSSGLGAAITAINPIAGAIFGGISSIFGFSRGGIVPRYYASGGIFQPKGTDTVPAMLTPGERVLTDRQNVELNRGFARMSSITQTAAHAQASSSRMESLLENIHSELSNRRYVTGSEIRLNNVQDKYAKGELKL